ncbi:TIR domain-containing protein [bacterium]|nr:TIR domain-containing protein [bacterium]
MNDYKIFISHGSQDAWLAGQISKEVRCLGGLAFLDESDIPKGSPDFKRIIREEIKASNELLALFTPWSAKRSWMWIEIGAAWEREIPIIAVFYGMEVSDLEDTGQGKAILEDINILNIDDLDAYLDQLRQRIKKAQT